MIFYVTQEAPVHSFPQEKCTFVTFYCCNIHFENLMQMAGSYLLESAEKESALWLTAEALDSLMDLFSEDCTDQAASEINLVRRLESLAPRLKTKVSKIK